MQVFNYISGATTNFTPTYPVGAGTFSIAGPSALFTINASTGVVTVTGFTSPGVYIVLITYFIGEVSYTMSITIVVQASANSLNKTAYEFCIDKGNQTRQLRWSNTQYNDYSKADSIPWWSVTTGGLLTINSDHADIVVNTQYTLEFSSSGGLSTELTVVFRECGNVAIQEINDCETDSSALVWISQSPARCSYFFNQAKVYIIEQDGGRTYMNADRETRWTRRGIVSDVIEVEQEQIPQSHVDFLETMLNSIQAWVCENVSDLSTYRAIIIDQGSYRKYRTGDSLYRISFRYSIAKPKVIQLQ